MSNLRNQNTGPFFALLRSGLYGDAIPEIDLPDNIDWPVIIELARRHTVLGVIIESVQYLPERLRPSESLMAKMNKFAIKLIQSNLGLDQKIGQLVSVLKTNDIQGVLLKGQGIARSYRVPQIRQTGDIDYYVGESQYLKAVQICKESFVKNSKDYYECNHHFTFKMDGVIVELHRIATETYTPINKKGFREWVRKELENSPNRRVQTIGNVEVALPSVDFDAIFIFYHAVRHYLTEGIGIRQLCDWAMVFHSCGDQIDRIRLVENIKRFGLTRGWKLFAYIAVQYLGVTEENMPLYDIRYKRTSEKLLETIIADGNFGTYSTINLPSRPSDYDLEYAKARVRYMYQYFTHTFPILPMEASYLFIERLSSAAKTTLEAFMQKLIGK